MTSSRNWYVYIYTRLRSNTSPHTCVVVFVCIPWYVVTPLNKYCDEQRWKYNQKQTTNVNMLTRSMYYFNLDRMITGDRTPPTPPPKSPTISVPEVQFHLVVEQGSGFPLQKPMVTGQAESYIKIKSNVFNQTFIQYTLLSRLDFSCLCTCTCTS